VSEKALCCWMNQETRARCNAPAEWEIYYSDHAQPYNETQSCTQHVGELLTDAPVHHIYRIEAEK
jgi:hypothetical protein